MSELIETEEDKYFLQLQIAKAHNKKLNYQLGIITSERDELKDSLKQIQIKYETTVREHKKFLKEKLEPLLSEGVTYSDVVNFTGKKARIRALQKIIDEQKKTIDKLMGKLNSIK